MAKEPKQKDAVVQYAPIQYLVKNEIMRSITDYDKKLRFTAFDLPVHAHTGTDSPQVLYNSVAGVTGIAITRTVILTPAQVLLLHTTPIELVPQPGKLSVIIVEGITARLVYGGTAYTGANNLEFRYTDAAGTKVTADMGSAFLDSAASAWNHVAGIVTAFAPIEGGSGSNGRIVVVVPVADPAAGNSQVSFTVKYRIVSFKA